MLPEMLLWVCSLSQGHPSGERSASMVATNSLKAGCSVGCTSATSFSVTVLLPSIAGFRSIIALLLSRARPTSSSSAFPPLFRSFSRSLNSRIRAISSPNPHFGALKAHIFLQKRDISGKRGVQPAVFYYDRVAKNGETLVPKPSGTSVLRVKALLEGHRLEKEK